MTNTPKAHNEPLIHISKRDGVSIKTAILIRAVAIIAALVITGLLVMILTGANPIKIYASMLDGCFGSVRKIMRLLQDLAILLCISLAVTPAFKMKFWNCGAEGQVLVGGLATAAIMFYFGNTVPTFLLIIMMVIASVLAGIVWAVIPAIFKAKWNTNETLFTLMMNYVAIQLVNIMINFWDKSGSCVLKPMYNSGLPKLFGQQYILNIIIVAALTAVVYIYLKHTKHGYEIAVVGESEKTAKYVGISVGKVIIRTVGISGALCGVAGLLLVGGTDYTISAETVGGQGFTAIMVSWLAKFDPLYMILTSFLITFLNKGTNQICQDSTAWGKTIDPAFSDIITAIMLLFIIGCEFFINYKIHFNLKKKSSGEVVKEAAE